MGAAEVDFGVMEVIHSQGHKYLVNDTIFVILPLFTVTLGFKLKSEDMSEVKTFSFNSRSSGITDIFISSPPFSDAPK